MNCDQVFDVLTRGPFPTGTACDPPVEAHLNECAECRRLAEALRPAIELFQESIGPEESRDLPGYWCETAGEARAPIATRSRWLDVRPASAGSWQIKRLKNQWTALAAWRAAAMLALGVTLGSLASSRLTLDRLSESPPVGGASSLIVPAGEGDQEPVWLAMMSPACRRQPLEPVTEAGMHASSKSSSPAGKSSSLAGLLCCTECHNNLANVPPHATRLVAQSCQTCHPADVSRRPVAHP